jgi:hypothetical protein
MILLGSAWLLGFGMIGVPHTAIYQCWSSPDGIGEGLNAQTIMLPDHRSFDGTPTTVSISSCHLIGGISGPTATTTAAVNSACAATASIGGFLCASSFKFAS